ncbi:MAG TPA: hypothetical protein VI564_00365 [Candidatus Nanoarchaeia archaeon]|nr:hypothetical protein [Candidatus Nanoarchaeia archaeon]
MNKKIIAAFAIILAVIILSLALWPVCRKIPNETLKSFNTPIETRADKDFYIKVFQEKNGEWYQCKTFLSRMFFG